MAAARRNGWGVGWVLQEGWVGIDLDDVIEDGRMQPWAEEIIRRVDGLAEVSPSGAGAHIIVRGALPGPSRKDGQLEIYAGGTGRYLTLTGEVIWPTWPADRTEAVAEIYLQHFGQADQPQAKAASSAKALEPPAGGIAPAGEDEVREALRRLQQRWPWGCWEAVWAGETIIGRSKSNQHSQSENHFAILLRLAWCGYDAQALARLAKACPAISGHPKAARPDYIWRTAARAWQESRIRTPGRRAGAQQQAQPFRLAPPTDEVDLALAELCRRPDTAVWAAQAQVVRTLQQRAKTASVRIGRQQWLRWLAEIGQEISQRDIRGQHDPRRNPLLLAWGRRKHHRYGVSAEDVLRLRSGADASAAPSAITGVVGGPDRAPAAAPAPRRCTPPTPPTCDYPNRALSSDNSVGASCTPPPPDAPTDGECTPLSSRIRELAAAGKSAAEIRLLLGADRNTVKVTLRRWRRSQRAKAAEAAAEAAQPEQPAEVQENPWLENPARRVMLAWLRAAGKLTEFGPARLASGRPAIRPQAWLSAADRVQEYASLLRAPAGWEADLRSRPPKAAPKTPQQAARVLMDVLARAARCWAPEVADLARKIREWERDGDGIRRRRASSLALAVEKAATLLGWRPETCAGWSEWISGQPRLGVEGKRVTVMVAEWYAYMRRVRPGWCRWAAGDAFPDEDRPRPSFPRFSRPVQQSDDIAPEGSRAAARLSQPAQPEALDSAGESASRRFRSFEDDWMVTRHDLDNPVVAGDFYGAGEFEKFEVLYAANPDPKEPPDSCVRRASGGTRPVDFVHNEDRPDGARGRPGGGAGAPEARNLDDAGRIHGLPAAPRPFAAFRRLRDADQGRAIFACAVTLFPSAWP
jgi:hypothetical protein